MRKCSATKSVSRIFISIHHKRKKAAKLCIMIILLEIRLTEDFLGDFVT
jgi:hypothetical protein